MNGPELLKQFSDTVQSGVGGFVPGEQVIFRGQDLFKDLKGVDWVELFVFGITGRHFSPEQVKLMHAIWSHTSYPDARLWNNRIAALTASSRSTGNLGLSAALAVSEATIYGRGVDIEAIDFIMAARERIAQGESINDCIKTALDRYRRVAGYGRPLKNSDERLAPTMALARELGLADGPHVSLAHQVEDALIKGRWRWAMNYGGLAAALGADLGLSRREYYLFMFPAFLAGMTPCLVEAADRPAGTLLPLSCDHLSYEGVAARVWPIQKSHLIAPHK